MTNAQPPPLLAAGLPLPTFAGLPVRLPDGGARTGDPPEPPLTAGAGLVGGAAGTRQARRSSAAGQGPTRHATHVTHVTHDRLSPTHGMNGMNG